MSGHVVGDLGAGSLVRMCANELGNDVTGFLHRDGIAEHDAFLADKVEVV